MLRPLQVKMLDVLARAERERWERKHKAKPKVRDDGKNKKLKRFLNTN